MSESITLYGISNCDTIKKAKNWLTAQGIAFDFHDYRKQGLQAGQLAQWVDELGWEAMLNRRGTTWRKVPEALKENLNQESALRIMLDNPAIIKRPLLVKGNTLQLGFSEDQYQSLFD